MVLNTKGSGMKQHIIIKELDDRAMNDSAAKERL